MLVSETLDFSIFPSHDTLVVDEIATMVELVIAIRRISLIVDFMIFIYGYPPNSRLVNKILELFAFGFFILIYESTSAASSHSLLLCPDSSSAILCAEVCKPLGQISYSIERGELKISKREKGNIEKSHFKDCKVQSKNEWLCNKVRYDENKRMFNGYEVVQMANGILSKQSFVFEKSQDKWKEVFQCSKVSFHGKKN